MGTRGPKGHDEKSTPAPGTPQWDSAQGPLPELTPKQMAFVRAVMVEGKTYSDAYKQAYNASGMKPKTIWGRSSALANKPEIREWMQRMRLLAMETAQSGLEDHLAQLRRIREAAIANKQTSAAAQAEAALGKALGFQDTRVTLADERKMADAVAAIRQHLGDEIAAEIVAQTGLDEAKDTLH